MDSLIAAAARALAAGDALAALDRVALRDDPPALALRGIAMAQLGELARARQLLRRAARAFGPREAVPRARCVVADAEVALAMRDIPARPEGLLAAAAILDAHGDHANAVHARLVGVRRLLLLGRLSSADQALGDIDTAGMPPGRVAVAELATAELALRRLHLGAAQAALARAEAAARNAAIAALQAEVAEMRALLERPAARLVGNAHAGRTLGLCDVATMLASGVLVVDACRHMVCAAPIGQTGGDADPTRRDGAAARRIGGLPGRAAMGIALARRPVLFALARELGQAWPGDAPRETLIARVFRTRVPDDTHRARLRVEIGRLRAVLRTMARIDATPRGFVLAPLDGRGVAVLAPPVEGTQAALTALLADGQAWSTSALALALDASQRTVQRALAELAADGRVRAVGQARNQRWVAPPLAGFTTILLLPVAQPFA